MIFLPLNQKTYLTINFLRHKSKKGGFGPLFISPPFPPPITDFGSRPLSAACTTIYFTDFSPRPKSVIEDIRWVLFVFVGMIYIITAFGSKPLSATHDLLYYRFQPKAKIGNLPHRGPDSCPQSCSPAMSCQ